MKHVTNFTQIAIPMFYILYIKVSVIHIVMIAQLNFITLFKVLMN